MSHTVKLTAKMGFGKFSGLSPVEIIRSKSEVGIRYLLWLREQRKGRFPLCRLDDDTHHSLDALIRANSELYSGYALRYDETAYKLWLAEKRRELKRKEEKKKQEETERLLKRQAYDRKIEKEKQKALDKLRKERERKERLRLDQIRCSESYSVEWGAW